MEPVLGAKQKHLLFRSGHDFSPSPQLSHGLLGDAKKKGIIEGQINKLESSLKGKKKT